ncbi:DegV family protein with EDD domain [Lactobacillus colini]|uniref:DegV family protein with EDD domain n=1 Tax=Lactobacillus colini TaxID=1819254 RepID=A0ABS4MHB2_9LACO|nr:DegV family protein [Lactobacillus colini]MBP2058712.1 DegV family protein with EDD domain [Lactobacillus colini]
MNIKIITDSSANLSTDDCSGISHISVPLTIQVGEQAFKDDDNLDKIEFMTALKNTKIKTTTSCPNVHEWLQAFEGGDEIYVFTITSALSGSYNAARQAANQYHETYPGAKILVFDTRSAGPQVKMLALKTGELIKQGLSFQEVVKKIEDYQQHANLIFALKDLTNLANNGRVPAAVAKIAGLLKLNIIGVANNKGEFELVTKARGDKRCYKKIVEEMVKRGYDGGYVQIDQNDNTAGAAAIKNVILDKFPNAKVEIGECHALCSYYAETGGMMIGYENK